MKTVDFKDYEGECLYVNDAYVMVDDLCEILPEDLPEYANGTKKEPIRMRNVDSDDMLTDSCRECAEDDDAWYLIEYNKACDKINAIVDEFNKRAENWFYDSDLFTLVSLVELKKEMEMNERQLKSKRLVLEHFGSTGYRVIDGDTTYTSEFICVDNIGSGVAVDVEKSKVKIRRYIFPIVEAVQVIYFIEKCISELSGFPIDISRVMPAPIFSGNPTFKGEAARKALRMAGVDEYVKIDDGRTVRVVEAATDGCDGCLFRRWNRCVHCLDNACVGGERFDHTDVIFQEVV